MNRVYVALVLILMIPISAHAQNEAEPPSSGDGSDYYLLPEMELEWELWDMSFDYSIGLFDPDLIYLESSWMDMDVLYDILLELCLDLEVTDEEMYGLFPDVWVLDYEFDVFWEYDW
jgi:hypothetical protein